MKKILYVEDDALIAHIYSRKLSEQGYEVEVAEDGLEAMKRLSTSAPDLVILDLLMPKFSGIDVLKFIRRSENLRSLRVIVFSNAFLSNLVDEVASSGVERALVKSSTTPAELLGTVAEVLAQPPASTEAPAPTASAHSDTNQTSDEAQSPPALSPVNVAQRESRTSTQTPRDRTSQYRAQFLEHRLGLIKSLRELCDAFVESIETKQEVARIEDLSRKVRFLSQMAGMAGAWRVAMLSSALEAMLFELIDKNNYLNGSSRETVAAVVAQLVELLESADASEEPEMPPARVLVVDDDVVSNRALMLALGRAQLRAASVTDPFVALKRLQDQAFDLVLMDINMPGLDGLTLCRELRSMPHQKYATVVFVTSYDDYKTRAQSVISGGDDFITKPILPVEVCVKAVSHLVRNLPGLSGGEAPGKL